MHAEGRTPFQKAVARLYNSPVGLGGGAYHGSSQEGEAESAYLGVMRRDVLDEVGLFDESIRRGEDWELNLRIRQAGHRVWFDPDLSVTYWPRESWLRLARQFRATGAWRGELVRRFGRSNGLRYFAPPALVAVVALAVLVGGLQVTGVLTGVASMVASFSCTDRSPSTCCSSSASRWLPAEGACDSGCGRSSSCRRCTSPGVWASSEACSGSPRHRGRLASRHPQHPATLTPSHGNRELTPR